MYNGLVAATELEEFQALSAKVSDKTASDEERARWRELRKRLAPPPMVSPPPPLLPRQHARQERKIKVALAPVRALFATFTEEISPGGMRVRVPSLLEPGTSLVLRLELGEPGPLVVAGRVAWCRRDGGHFEAGVELVGLREDERERIEAYAVNAPPTTARK